MKASVPRPWSVEETERGNLILFNVATGETHPIEVPADNSTSENPQDFQPRYEALSYVWGAAQISEYAEVEAEGFQTPTKLGIRPNLASALRHLRYPSDTRVLWIDAICINQDDILERNEQVKRMTNIYTFAHQVVAWLGEESNDSKHALATLQHVSLQLEATKAGRVIAAPGASEPRLWRNDHAAQFDERTWQSLMNFVQREWFYRLWIWQEINLAGKGHMQCGSDKIQWSDFWLAILCLNNKNTSLQIRFREQCRHIVFLKYGTGGHSMANILDISRSKGCVNPSDKIYGLLGITATYFSSRITVDYLRPVEDVYKEAFLVHANVTQRLELLKHCNLADRQVGGPSWVPDWSKTELAAPLLSEQLSSGMSRAWFTHRENGMLEVHGIQHTTVKSVSCVASKVEADTLLAVKDWFKDLPVGDYCTGESMETALALTLCMERTGERNPYNHNKSTAEWVQTLHKMLSLNTDSRDDPFYLERETANTIQKVRGRRLFVTENGLIGTAPACTQIGDSISLLLGTYAPVVLRPTTAGTFQVVGECYVYGLSDGVCFLGPLPKNWKVIIRGDALGRPFQLFTNIVTGQETMEDPRMSLPPNWEPALYERLPDDPALFHKFRNIETGEVINHDPRLMPETLKARGVSLQVFTLT
ncbi:heterokaryon incompatibility protein [Fusarium heterosporum]|uniref:Heterokaryon incompatibility protein n=1 Tax=Fusarium heterosporum TaxID=42747 RepID=A0A8H5T148_FUSHE|nr:heterokaryon incompatibility protein [Fusarium heterosporum]